MNNQQEYLNNLRHSCAHLLAKAVLTIWPGTHNAIGPAIENGFYQDFDFGDVKISDADLPGVEEKMIEILKTWNHFEYKEVSLAEAEKLFAHNPYKVELAREFAAGGKTLHTNNPGGFLDLCKMTHVENPQKEMQHFKLLKIAGAYWRGSEKNKMLTRIYGTCFPTKEELDHYLWQQEEAKKRDHRKIGKELNLFIFSDLVGRGLPLFTPKGTVLREELNNFSQGIRIKRGFERVWIPHLTKNDLYKVSGHWDKFKDELLVMDSKETGDVLVVKPMNCPHHQQIYASQPRSYKDLPIRYLETTAVYRDEKAGEMIGLARVRSVTQDDSHIFCTPEQILEVYGMLIDVVKEFYGALGMKYRARLSFRSPETPEKYLGDLVLWKKAQSIILKIAKESGLNYYEAPGEAAFYGPKIDIMVSDSLGREWQLATPQLDFVQPERFGLAYTDAEGKEQTPVMIHFALMGSLERFLSVYIEHTAGAFPVWLSPVQVGVIPVSDKVLDYAKEIEKKLKDEGLRVELNDKNEKLGAKIRDAQLQKIPYMIIIGQKEQEIGKISLRLRDERDLGQMGVEEFTKSANNRILTKSLDLW